MRKGRYASRAGKLNFEMMKPMDKTIYELPNNVRYSDETVNAVLSIGFIISKLSLPALDIVRKQNNNLKGLEYIIVLMKYHRFFYGSVNKYLKKLHGR